MIGIQGTATGGGRIEGAMDEGGFDLVEVTLSWCTVGSMFRGDECNVLAVEHVKKGSVLALGERGGMMIPEEVLGADRIEVVRYEGDSATATAPPGARLHVDGCPSEHRVVSLAYGHLVEMAIGAFVVRIELARAARRPASAPLDGLQGSGAGCFAGSALLHAAAFAAIALFAPMLGATEEDPFDADRLALMQRLLNASAQHETERVPDDGAAAGGGDVNPGKAARDPSGASGRPDTEKNGRWAARGTAHPETATLAREHEKAAAETFGVIGILASAFQNDPNAPVVSWGTVSNGSDDVSKIGHLYGGTIDDAAGVGGVGPWGLDQGGGGIANLIGLNGVDALGHTGSCAGGPCDGIGVGVGRPNGGHVSHFKGPRYGTPTTNGRLAPEIIQRVVRLNDGRYRFCYQSALHADPNLRGRVTVKFMIDRQGAVAFAADGGSDIPDEGVRQCVVRSFQALSFPEPENGTVTVVYPIVFSPE
ncbi:MAG: AgmX/PglI C-terminal domain-containing protein [Polyangiaceae bacterium]